MMLRGVTGCRGVSGWCCVLLGVIGCYWVLLGPLGTLARGSLAVQRLPLGDWKKKADSLHLAADASMQWSLGWSSPHMASLS